MDTTVSFDYKDFVPNGTGILELKCKLNSFLDSEIDEWKRSLQDHMIFDHELRVLRRHCCSSLWKSVSLVGSHAPCGKTGSHAAKNLTRKGCRLDFVRLKF